MEGDDYIVPSLEDSISGWMVICANTLGLAPPGLPMPATALPGLVLFSKKEATCATTVKSFLLGALT